MYQNKGPPESRIARELEAREELEQRRVDDVRRLLLHPVPGARDDDLGAQIVDPTLHRGGRHELAHRVELAGEEERRLGDVTIGDRLGELPVAVDVAIPVEPAREPRPLERADIYRELLLGEPGGELGLLADLLRPCGSPLARSRKRPADVARERFVGGPGRLKPDDVEVLA